MNNKIAVFIMVHGRPDKMKTFYTLRNQGFTGDIHLIADDQDGTADEYKSMFPSVIVFEKNKTASRMDSGDNSGDLRSTLFAANTAFDLAEAMGITHFFLMCDDYYDFYYAFPDTKGKVVPKNLDRLFCNMVDFYEASGAKSLAFAQTGDFIGGIDNGKQMYRFSKRKVMNTFLCSPSRRFQFVGRLNEDVTTYTLLGGRGNLFLTIPVVAMGQKDTQQEKNGLSNVYRDNGTYVKSFFSVMYNPSCVKTAMMGANHKRIHHTINWANAVPQIIDSKYKK
jgi:hypothetical protein